jgi:cell surface protein SprA
VDINNPNRAATTVPDVEDVNKDNTMNLSMRITNIVLPLTPNMLLDKITLRIFVTPRSNALTQMGEVTDARWIQFKIQSQPENTMLTYLISGLSDL